MGTLFLVVFWLVAQTNDPSYRFQFLDEGNNPIDVLVAEFDAEPNASREETPRLQRSHQGQVEVPGGNHWGQDRCCFVYAAGKAIDLFSLQDITSRTMTVTLKDESDIEVEVIHPDGSPVSHATVSPGNVRFQGWLANVPYRLPSEFVTQTDAHGKAKLKGVVAEQLLSVRIRLGDHRGQTFHVPSNWDRKSNLRIRWDPKTGEVRWKFFHAEGTPLRDARVFAWTSDEEVNPFAIFEPTLIFSEYTGKTDDHGEVSLHEVPAGKLSLRVFSNESSVGVGLLETVQIHAGRRNERLFKMAEPTEFMLAVSDLETGQGIEGITVLASSSEKKKAFAVAQAKTNDDGLVEFRLQPGNWKFFVDDTGLPSDYCMKRPSQKFQQIQIARKPELQVGPTIFLTKGRSIAGTMIGVELQRLRYDWIQLTTADQSWMGKWDHLGNFSISIPKEISDAEIVAFEIAASDPKGKLEIVRRSPWVLSFRKQEAP